MRVAVDVGVLVDAEVAVRVGVSAVAAAEVAVLELF